MHLVFFLLSFANPKIKEGFRLRKNKSWLKADATGPIIWIHVASGEFEYAKPVITRLKKLCPEHKILMTFFSPSVLKSALAFKDLDFAVPMPWDTAWHWKEFINNYKPKILAIARTDFWPQMLWQTRKANIPSLLFAATLPSTSGRVASFWGRLLYSDLLENLTYVSCVSVEDEDNFRRLDSRANISVDGDTRYDQVLLRLNNPKHIKFTKAHNQKNDFDSAKILVAGSTWPEDEKILIPALPELLRWGLSVLLAPHEPTTSHLESLENQLKQNGISNLRYTKLVEQTKVPKGTVILIDEVGILAELYSLADFSFVGGSFKRSVHSVMEPAAAGAFTLMGPYHHNSREALALKKAGLAYEIGSTSDFKQAVETEFNLSQGEYEKRKAKILAFVNRHTGVSETIALWIKTHMQN